MRYLLLVVAMISGIFIAALVGYDSGKEMHNHHGAPDSLSIQKNVSNALLDGLHWFMMHDKDTTFKNSEEFSQLNDLVCDGWENFELPTWKAKEYSDSDFTYE